MFFLSFLFFQFWIDLSLCPDEQILNGNQLDMDDGMGCENQDEEAVAMVEETQSGFYGV